MRSALRLIPARAAKTVALAAKNQIAALRTQNRQTPKIWTGWADRGQTCPVRYNCNYRPKITQYYTDIAIGQTGQTYYIRVRVRKSIVGRWPIMRHGGFIRARTRVIAGYVHPAQSCFCAISHIFLHSRIIFVAFLGRVAMSEVCPPCPTAYLRPFFRDKAGSRVCGVCARSRVVTHSRILSQTASARLHL